MIPVYGLSGIEEPNLDGVYTTTYHRTGNRAADIAAKKARILDALKNDFPAYRLAQVILPYAVDIDEKDGGYIFPTFEVARIAADGEEWAIKYLATPGATAAGYEEGLQILEGNIFKAIGKGIKNVGKSVGKAVKTTVKTTGKAFAAAGKSTWNATKAGLNVMKASGQLIVGKPKDALKTLKKAAGQYKDSVIEPIITAKDNTVDLVKDTVVNPTVVALQTARDITKETIKIAGKVFKVLFIKINPVTVLIRNSLRALIAINFLGMGTRLNVGLLTQQQAEQLGYSAETWQKAVTAVNRLKKLYKKMGGNVNKLLKSITTGAGRKPLFKKDIPDGQMVNFANTDEAEQESSLGFEPATVTSLVAACIGILTQIWSWISAIIKAKQANSGTAAENAQLKQQAENLTQQLKDYDTALQTWANDGKGNFFTDENGNLITWEDYEAAMAQQADDAQKKKKILIGALIGTVALSAVIMITKK